MCGPKLVGPCSAKKRNNSYKSGPDNDIIKSQLKIMVHGRWRQERKPDNNKRVNE